MTSIDANSTPRVEPNKKMPPPATGAAAPGPQNPRPILKVNTGARQPSFSGDGATPTPSGEKKTIKIRLNSQPNTPAPSSAVQTPSIMKTKAGRTTKPTAKLTESKKRGYDSDEDRPMAATRLESASRPSKMIKIRPANKSTPTTPHSAGTPLHAIKFRPKGEPIPHKPGDAYDSEASDRETDPIRESTFVLRVMDGEPANYLKKAIAEGNIGISKQQGGADFSVQFLDQKERRAMVTINGIQYAAVLVALPTITEAMKTWDRKNMMKNSDVTEMLLCFAVVKNENDAKLVPLPRMVENNELKWPHGITPPMHDAANRRFRKVLTEKEWKTTSQQVAQLLADDEAAVESHITELNDEGDAYSDDEDAEGEYDEGDYFGAHQDDQNADMDVDGGTGDDDDDDIFAAMEAELENDPLPSEELMDAATPATQPEAPTPMAVDANTPAPLHEEAESEEDEDDDDDMSDEDDDDDEPDDAEKAAEKERKVARAELQDLQKQLSESENKLAITHAPILKKRVATTIENLKKEIAVKKAAAGMVEED